jgi:hypothetical protein
VITCKHLYTYIYILLLVALVHLTRTVWGMHITAAAPRRERFSSRRSLLHSSRSCSFWRMAYRLRTLPVAPPGGLTRMVRGMESQVTTNLSSDGGWGCECSVNLAHSRQVLEGKRIRGNSRGRDVENGGNTFFNSCVQAVQS